jgi:hypothetical protein
MNEVWLPVVYKVLQCLSFHNAWALACNSNSFILHTNKKILSAHKHESKDPDPKWRKHWVLCPHWKLILIVSLECNLNFKIFIHFYYLKLTPWSESASKLYRPSDRRLSAKWLSTFADRGCHVVSVTDPYGHILGFLDRSRYFSIK